MTAVRWIDGINGDDLNNGLTELTAWGTLNHAGEWPNNGVVFIKDGVYKETLSITSSTKSPTFVGVGDSVWIDGEGIRANCIYYSFSSGTMACGFSNLKLTGFTADAIYARHPAIEAGYNYGCIVRNCLITQPNPSDRIGMGVDFYSNSSKILMINCQIERVDKALDTACVQRNNIFRDYNTLGTFFSLEYCSYPGGSSPNVDYTATPPTFRNAPNWDYSVDPNGANAASYIANGWQGSNIGMQAAGSKPFTSTSHIPTQGFNTGDSVLGDWINDADCYDVDFPSITIALGVNDALDFDEGGAELNAVIAPAVYITEATLRSAIKTALEAVGGDTYTIGWTNGYLTFTKDGGGTFNLLSNSGTNVGTSAWEDIGFTTSINRNGSLTYSSTYTVTKGSGSNFIVTISAARGNNKLDFDEGAGELTATIADTSSATLSIIALAVKTALDAAGLNTYTVTYDGDGVLSERLRITTSGGTLTLKISTGANAGSSAWDMLGWDLIANKSGATSYLADYKTTSAPWLLDADRRPVFNINYEPDGRMTQGRSSLIDTGTLRNIRNVEWRGSEDTGNGLVFNADDAIGTPATRRMELRADPSTYFKDSADTGLNHNFTKFNRFDVIDWPDQHAQLRWTLRAVKL